MKKKNIINFAVYAFKIISRCLFLLRTPYTNQLNRAVELKVFIERKNEIEPVFLYEN